MNVSDKLTWLRFTQRWLRLVGASFLAIAIPLWLLASPPAGQPQKSTAQYVGTDTCKTCHEDVYKNNFETTPHFKTTLQNGHGCESCHGPGSAHVEGGGDVTKIASFKTMSKQDANAHCLSCHGESHEQRHFSASVHAGNNVGCLDCHS